MTNSFSSTEERKMSNLANIYIPEFVPDNLRWYEKDDLMAYIGKLAYIFIKDTDGHLKRIQVINFDTIHKQTRSEKIDENLLKEYRTDDNWRISFYPEKEEKALSSAFRCPRKDFFTKETVNALFKKMADKIVVEEFDICHKFVDGLIYDSEHINYLISHNLVFDFIEYNDFKLNLLIN